MKSRKNTVSRVISYLRYHTLLFVVSLIFAAITVAATLYVPILIGDGIDVIVDKANVDLQKLSSILVRVAVCVGVGAVSQWLMNVLNNKIAFEMVKRVRNDAFEKIQRLPMSYFDSRSTGETVSKIITDVEQFSDGLLMGFTQFFTGVLTIVGTLALMISINFKIALVVVLVTPISLFVAAFIAKRTHTMFLEQSKKRAQQTSFIDEMISNQKIVKAFNHEDEALSDFEEINEGLEKASLKATFFSSITNPSTRFVNSLVYTGVALFGALSCIGGSAVGISIGQLSCFLSYANQYTKPFNEISGVVTELQNALACAARIFEIIDEEPEPSDPENASVIEKNSNPDISLENVSFSYLPDQKLIQNLDLHVTSGEHVAIVGPTGCGKTTLINLLMRFYDVTGGSIKIGTNDMTDIRDISRSSLHSSYGMVLQDTWLKSGTIRENIVLGKPDATDDEIIQAAKLSHAHSFIKRLPNGYDTVITESGGILSQGQKQLLCITRIMLCLPPMLILDEATSSIDTRTELKIQSAFAEIMKGRTSFIVAHRLSTIKDADIILVMKDGNIVEQGSHDELLAKKGFYYNLYNSQFSH